MKAKLRRFQARLFCGVALGIGWSSSLAAATFGDANWTTVGSGVKNTVHALAVSGSDVYAGGEFTTAGGSAANCIAKWDGSTWSALGSGMDGGYYPYVFALAVSGSNVHAARPFSGTGCSAAKRVANLSEGSWTALGSGINGPVNALAVSGSDLYAGGEFTTAGGSAAS